MYAVMGVLISGMTFGVRAEGDRETEASPACDRAAQNSRAAEASTRSRTFRGLVSGIGTPTASYAEPDAAGTACAPVVAVDYGGWRL
jgi:hypothetical protein